MPSKNRECNWCQKQDDLKTCQQCILVDYCCKECQVLDWKGGHKILCAKVPREVKKAEEKIRSFRLSSYTTKNAGTFMVTEAQAQRGQIVEEEEAQTMCYDAMEMEEGSQEKLLEVLDALSYFPLSTEAWGMLGHFYFWGVLKIRTKECSTEALKMHDNAIVCARKLNPTWSDDRKEELQNDIEHRPYLRSLCGRAFALKGVGKTRDAIIQGKKLLRINPRDGQGIRKYLCSWYLEMGDTEGPTNLLRRFGTSCSAPMAYHDVLLQFLLWEKDDTVENDVKKALYVAMKENTFVPDLVLANDEIEMDEDSSALGSIEEGKVYARDFGRIWQMCIQRLYHG